MMRFRNFVKKVSNSHLVWKYWIFDFHSYWVKIKHPVDEENKWREDFKIRWNPRGQKFSMDAKPYLNRNSRGWRNPHWQKSKMAQCNNVTVSVVCARACMHTCASMTSFLMSVVADIGTLLVPRCMTQARVSRARKLEKARKCWKSLRRAWEH